jgi:hypothetical protein
MMRSDRGNGEPICGTRGSRETTDWPIYGFTNSTVPATGPRESSASFGLAHHSFHLYTNSYKMSRVICLI